MFDICLVGWHSFPLQKNKRVELVLESAADQGLQNRYNFRLNNFKYYKKTQIFYIHIFYIHFTYIYIYIYFYFLR